jgi:hypothetical protein
MPVIRVHQIVWTTIFAGVLFLTFIQPDLRLFRKVEMWNSRSISSNESQVVCGRKLDSVAPMIQLRGDFHDATVLRKFGDVPDNLSAL